MVPLNELLLFAGAALLMVLTPGPNMIYLISRSMSQGRKAGVISLIWRDSRLPRAHVCGGRWFDHAISCGASCLRNP